MKKRWQKFKNHVLGQNFDLSIVLADDKLMTELNARYRKKTGSSNVLSFALSKGMGEIFLNKKFTDEKDYSDFLVLHSLLHLKGYEHGEEMGNEEDKLIKEFKINYRG